LRRIGGESEQYLSIIPDHPYGETCAALHEDSAEGTAIIDKAFIRGVCIENFRLTFSAGRIREVSAPHVEGIKIWQDVMDVATGDKDVIAELGVGANPGITQPTGNISLDEKISGSIHIAVGINNRFGGKNSSNLHQDLVILKPTVWFDEKVILENGEFKI
jgi:aminopeptidase